MSIANSDKDCTNENGQTVENKRSNEPCVELRNTKRHKRSHELINEGASTSMVEIAASKDEPETSLPVIQANINDFPPEVFQLILAVIVKYISWRKLISLRLVCKYWRANVDGYLASRHSFKYAGRLTKGAKPPVIHLHEFNAMLSFYPNMRELFIQNFTANDALICVLRENVPKIEKLSLYNCQNLSSTFFTILSVRYRYQLKLIDISHCNLSEYSFSVLIEDLRNLRGLNAINPGRAVTYECLARIGPFIQNIWISLKHLPDCNPALRALVAGNGRNVSHLGLVVGDFQTTEWNLISENMQHLKSLKLTFGSFKRSNLNELSKLRNLEFLVLSENSYNESESVLTDESLCQLFKGCRRLTSLALSGSKPHTLRITNRVFQHLTRWCTKLEQLRLLKANHIDDEGLKSLANLPSLFVLNLADMNAVTDAGIKTFVESARHVRSLRLSHCTLITETVIDDIIAVAKERPDERINLYLEGMVITKDLNKLPNNLRINAKLSGSVLCPGQITPIN